MVPLPPHRPFLLALAVGAASCGLLDDRTVGVAGPTNTRAFVAGTPVPGLSEADVVLYGAEVVDANGARSPLFSSLEGVEFNLANLGAFFATMGTSLPTLTPASLAVEFAPEVRLVDAGYLAAELRLVDPSVPRTADGHVRLELALPARSRLGGGDVVALFGLDSFLIPGPYVTPTLRESLIAQVPDERQLDTNLEGFVHDYTGPGEPFVLERFSGERLRVRLADPYSIGSDDGLPPPLVSGDRVRAFGTQLAGDDAMQLTAVTIHAAPGRLRRGTVVSRDLVARVLFVEGEGETFMLNLSRAVRCVDTLGAYEPCAMTLETAKEGTLVEASGHWVAAANRHDALYFRVVPDDEAYVLGRPGSASGGARLHLDDLAGHRGLDLAISGLDLVVTPSTQLVDAAGALLVNSADTLVRAPRLAVFGRRDGEDLVAITIRLE